MISNTALSADEIEFAQTIISNRHPGFYTILDIFGPDFYNYILDKNAHEMRFKASVRAGSLTAIKWHHDQSDHIAVYEIDHQRLS